MNTLTYKTLIRKLIIGQDEPGRMGAGVARMCQGRVNNSYSTTCARCDTLVTKLLISHDRKEGSIHDNL